MRKVEVERRWRDMRALRGEVEGEVEGTRRHIRSEIIEECAVEAERDKVVSSTSRRIAAAIRALKDK